MRPPCYGHVRAIGPPSETDGVTSEPRTAPLHRPPVGDRWGDWCLSMVEGEAGYSCANHCEASLRCWPLSLAGLPDSPGVAVLPVKGTRCSDSTPWVAQRALPSSCTSTAPNLPSPSSRRHPKAAVGGSRCAASSAGWAPPVPTREADCCAGSATGRTSKAVAMEPSAEGRPGSLSGPDDPPPGGGPLRP